MVHAFKKYSCPTMSSFIVNYSFTNSLNVINFPKHSLLVKVWVPDNVFLKTTNLRHACIVIYNISCVITYDIILHFFLQRDHTRVSRISLIQEISVILSKTKTLSWVNVNVFSVVHYKQRLPSFVWTLPQTCSVHVIFGKQWFKTLCKNASW